jgi:large subunit ribosomal protein L4
MYQLEVKSVAGGAVSGAGTVTVDPASLGGAVRSRLVHQACVMYAANRRVGTHKTRTRAELSGSNKKPWRQKGTGRARAGTRRSPLWRGGGTIFGPVPRDYSYALSKKARRRAAQSAFHSKLRDGETIVVDGIASSGKTRDLAKLLKTLGCEKRWSDERGRARLTPVGALVVTADHDEALARAARNLPNAKVMPVAELNAFDLLSFSRLVIT